MLTELYQAHHLYSKYIIAQEKETLNESQLNKFSQNIVLYFIKKIPSVMMILATKNNRGSSYSSTKHDNSYSLQDILGIY
jgi:hypothetical protein